MSRALMMLAIAALGLAACAGADPSDGTPASLGFRDPATAMDEVDCERLATEDEVEGIVGRDLTALGRSASSCYWTGFPRHVQLVFNTSTTFAGWRDALLETYTDHIVVDGLDLWAEPGSDSVAAFGPDRGLVVHGMSQREAASFLRLALARL